MKYIIDKSETQIHFDPDLPIKTKDFKGKLFYSFSGKYEGKYTGQIKVTKSGLINDDWIPHGFGRLVFNQKEE